MHASLDLTRISHVLAVTSLSFCPKQDEELSEGVVARLASGSEDKSVRIFDIKL
jgi:WD40 repeat protein